MKLLIFLSLFIIQCQSVTHYDLVRAEWETFKATYNKNYVTENEEQRRMKIFMEEKYRVALHNKRYAQGLVSFQAGINSFSDMTSEEFFKSRKCLDKLKMGNLTGIPYVPLSNPKNIPDQVDWRDKGAVTPVKTQGCCGGCYSFSTTGALEAQQFLKTGKLVSLSEQNIIDCSRKYGNDGCEGGWMHTSFEYIKENGGIDTEESYPYEEEDENGCRYNPENVGATITNFSLTHGEQNETLLKEMVATIGPVSIAIYSSLDSFKSYTGDGVFDDPECLEDSPTHAVLVVGYGTNDKGEDYWIVKNSWGEDWGDGGYVKMARNKNNQCGISDYMCYPII